MSNRGRGSETEMAMKVLGKGISLCVALAVLPLTGCISDEKAVEMGLASNCDGKQTISAVGDPAGRYVSVASGESCKGPRRDTYDRRTLTLVDCKAPASLAIKVAQLAADPSRHGTNYDHSAQVEQQSSLLRIGLTDLEGVRSALQAAGVPATLTPGIAGEECTRRAL